MVKGVTADTRRWLGIAAWIVATGLLVLLFHSVDTSRVFRVLEHADVRWLVAAVASNAAIQPFGAAQWRALLPSSVAIGRARVFRLFALTSVANNTTPSLVGHATGALLLAAEPGVGKAAALSALALDQVAVGIVKVGVLLTAALLLRLPGWMRDGLTGLAVVVGVMIVAAAIVARRTRYLDVLREPWRFAAALGFAVCVKLAEAGAIFAVQHAFALPLPAHAVVVVLAATALSSVVPIAPANIGTYEAASFAAYRYLGLAPEAALGIAVIQHVCQLLPAVGVGYVMLSIPRFSARIPSPVSASEN